MAAMNVRILSREFIKPSIPTPHTQSQIKFSGLDHIYADCQFPSIFFFKNQPSSQMDNSRKSKQLKESLSLALTKFYPFAGRIKEDYSSFLCNDDGALYIEAQVDANLTDDTIHNGQFFQHLGKSRVPLSVQLTFFNCGGTAIGIHYSHWIADAWTFAMFLNHWAGISQLAGAGAGANIQPKFGFGSDIFPLLNRETPSAIQESKKMILKRFLFKNEKISDLKRLASSGNCPIQDPTRVEAVSGFVWKEIIQMHKSKPSPKTECIARFPVNLRNRLGRPQINDSAMGNFVISTPVLSTSDTETDLGYLVGEFRKAANFHKKIDMGFDCVTYCFESFEAATKPEVWSCMFTSLCGIPMYEVDFGWGKPLLIIPKATKPLVLLATAENGIEAWINLCVDEMGMISKNLLSLEIEPESAVKIAHSRL